MDGRAKALPARIADLDVNVGKEREGFGAGNFAHLIAEFVATLRNQILPQSLHHIDTFRSFCQLTFGRCQHPLEPDHDEVPHDERFDVVRAAPHELLFELDDGGPNSPFHLTFGSSIVHLMVPSSDSGANYRSGPRSTTRTKSLMGESLKGSPWAQRPSSMGLMCLIS